MNAPTKSPRVAGFRAHGVHAGLKPRALDVTVIAADEAIPVAGVFTTTQAPGAPVVWTRARVAAGRARALVVNAGNANVATGSRGRRDTEVMAGDVAKGLGCPPRQVLVASTGVIGVPLPMATLRRGIRGAVKGLTPAGLGRSARAIMTTDTVPKIATRRFELAGRETTLCGIAKGSGMIEPGMATMLAFLMTDADASPSYLQGALRRAADESFNRVTVDGEMSTSDMTLLLASGRAGNPALRSRRSASAEAFEDALGSLSQELARVIARDGEGATKLLIVDVSGAKTRAQATTAARRVANSMLVKTAIYGCDPNWGRILQTLGAGDVAIRPDRLTISVGSVCVYRRGVPAGKSQVLRASRSMKAEEVSLRIDLGTGRAEGRVYSCDLSHGYISINADYTT